MKPFIITAYLACSILTARAQFVFSSEKPPENWFNTAYDSSNVYGIATAKAYAFLEGKKAETVIVAVLDGGVEIDHEDLKGKIWTNLDEISNNNKDDDKNGYIDDIHGWNFIGGSNGKNINFDNFEATRLYKKLQNIFKEISPEEIERLNKQEAEEYALWQKLKNEIDSVKFSAGFMLMYMKSMVKNVEKLKSAFAGKQITAKDLASYSTEDEALKKMATQLSADMPKTDTVDADKIFSNLLSSLKEYKTYLYNQVNYHYNPDFNPRDIVGDNYADKMQRYYGNNDYEGPDADHGTHVAGIIGAVRNNGIGIKGVAENVKIMVVRVVPNGDERDKDVANAIRYAVENGAQIINMSFGKAYSPEKSVVDAAVIYAQKNDVILVHAAGNESINIDEENGVRYPSQYYLEGGKAKLWLEVGASSWKTEDNLVGDFSNYGNKSVAFFAPGVDILSTTIDNGYVSHNGTSMAAPVASGALAVLLGYFPDLSPKTCIKILKNTVTPLGSKKVIQPGPDFQRVAFEYLSEADGIINLYSAVVEASKKSKVN